MYQHELCLSCSILDVKLQFLDHSKAYLARPAVIYRGLQAQSDKAALDTVCKALKGQVERSALFARHADENDWARSKG
jgi:hypothetical protein